MASIGGPNIVESELVLYVDAASIKSYQSGSATWSDLARSGVAGTLVNGPTYNNVNGGFLAFDGVNEYVSWGDTFDLTATSISGFVWGWANSLNEYIPWIDKLAGNGNYRLHSGADGRINFGIRNTANTYQEMNYAAGLLTNTWYNIGFTFNNSTRLGRIYVNGNLSSSNTFTIDRGDTSVDLQTGYQGNNGGTLNGRIATLSLYNKELSAQEVLQNYNAIKSRFGL
jgi:hypothetical protein